jgi:hypothetical protein
VKTLFVKLPVTSKRLEQLTGELFPDYMPILAEFGEMIVWKQARGHRIPEPVLGLDPEFDQCNEDVNRAKADLDDYLESVKKSTSSEAKYIFTSKKFRYEIELPSKTEVDEGEFILTSKV